MTPDDDGVRFVQAFNRLAVALRLPADQTDEAMQRVYWDAMADLPVDVVELAAEGLARTAQWFPKASEWREAASRQRLQQVIALPSGRDDPWSDECQACEDTGWEQKRCYPGSSVNCGRPKCVTGGEHRSEHGYVVRCSCRDQNRTYHRRHRVPKGRERYTA